MKFLAAMCSSRSDQVAQSVSQLVCSKSDKTRCFTSVSPVFHLCFTSVLPVFHQCFTSVSPVFHTEWDKMFYLVGANTCTRKFHPKQQELDATEGVQNSIAVICVLNMWFTNLYFHKCRFGLPAHSSIHKQCMLCVIGRIPSFDRKNGNTLKLNLRQNSVNVCKNFV